MKVLDFGPEQLTVRTDEPEPIDLTRCTRCGESWSFDLVERVEIWSCDHCGYEARERSSDFRRILIAQHEAMIS